MEKIHGKEFFTNYGTTFTLIALPQGMAIVQTWFKPGLTS